MGSDGLKKEETTLIMMTYSGTHTSTSQEAVPNIMDIGTLMIWSDLSTMTRT